MAKPKKSPPRSPTLRQVRIIGGEYRRRLVSFVDADGLRPTPDRLRETLFNWLNNDLPNANVLDCCAGSGVLGFEAISRGAKSATMIEPNLTQYRQLQATADTLQIPPHKIQLINSTAQMALANFTAPFDIILLDPPYDLGIWLELLDLIKQQALIHGDSLIYIESNQALEDLLTTVDWIKPIKSSKVGQIYAGLYSTQ